MITSWNGDLMGYLMEVLTWIFGGDIIYIYILAQPVFRGIDITIKNPDISNEE